MIEALFPLVGAAFVVLVVLPSSALVAKLALVVLERGLRGGLLHRLNLRYLVLTGASVLPLAWFFSAALHQVEGTEAHACLFDHGVAALCFEPGYFGLALAVAVAVMSRGVIGRLRPPTPAAHLHALAARIDGLLGHQPALHVLRGRIVVTDTSGFAVGTFGWARPRVFVGAAFADLLSDEMLTGALAHEREHVRALDPLRYLVLEVALAVNPLGRFLLAPHAARWLAARESHCDREAVIGGARPLPLADAIVRAARLVSRPLVALGGSHAAALKFRISLLLAFAERGPGPCCTQGAGRAPLSLPLALLVLALLSPHQAGTAALDAIHTGVETALTSFYP